MNWQYTGYTLPLLLATTILVALALYTRRHRSTPGAGTFALLMAAAAWWSLTYTLQLSGADLETKVFWAKIKYLAVVTLPMAWLAFSLQYTGRERRLTRRNLALLSVMPLVTLALVATNEAHYLIWEPEMVAVGSFSVLHMGFGGWFWVHTAYSYGLLLIGTVLLLWTILPSLRLYFPQSAALLLGVLIPWVSNALYILRISPLSDLDLTPFAFTLSGIFFTWGLLRFRLLDLVPIARSSIVDRIPTGIVVVDGQERIVDLNPAALDILNRPPLSVVGRSAPEALPDVAGLLARHRDEDTSRKEVSLRNGAGGRDYELEMSYLRDERGEPAGQLILLHDITERKQTEDSLRASETRFRSVVESLGEALLITDTEDVVLFVNLRTIELTGYTEKEMLGRPAYELFLSPEEWPDMFERNRRRTRGIPERYEMRLKRKNGEIIWTEINATPYRNAEGEVIGTLGAITDITERKRSEEALRKSEQRFRQLFDQSVDPLLIHDEHGKMVDCNPEACRVHGYTREEMLSLSIRDLTDTLISDKEKSIQEQSGGTLWQRTVAGDPNAFGSVHLGEHKRKDGTTFPVEVRVGSVAYDERTLVLASVRDVTERKRIEEALRESEERFRTLVQYGSDIISILEADGTIRYESPAVERVLGYPPEETIGTNAFDYIHPDDLEPIVDSFFEIMATNKSSAAVELRFRHADGSWCHLEAIGVNLTEDPAIQGFVVNSRDITERKRMEKSLRESEERFRAIFESSSVGISIATLDRVLLETNPAYQEMTGYSGEELYNKPIDEISHPNDVPADGTLNEKLLSGELGEYHIEKRYLRKDGELIWIRLSVSAARDAEGNPQFLVGLVEDITRRKQAEAALRESEQRFRQLFEHSVDLLFVHDEKGQIFDCNTEVCRALGYTREELLDRRVGDIATRLLSGKEKRTQESETLWQRAARSEPGGIVGFEQNDLRRKDGTSLPVEIGVGAIDYGGQRMIFASARDITERKKLEEQLRFQAFHDPLTHLPNRSLFMERLQHALSRLPRSQKCLAVLFMDLDNFKVINDSLGHELGDRLLQQVASRLREHIRPEDTVARFGGDEFTVLLEGITDTAEAEQVAQRVLEALRVPFGLRQQEVFASVTIGIAFEDSNQNEPDELLRKADLAMYEAKRSGRARYMLFEPSMTVRIQERMELERDLRRGVEENEFVVYYQPKIVLETGEVSGFEALVRWEHPSRGVVPPNEFLPVAEETGLILQIDRTVLEEACQQIREWQQHYSPDLIICKNLYQNQLQEPDLVEKVANALREADLYSRNLILEITEEVVMKDEANTLEVLRSLKALGLQLAIDDFGTGYSSLDYLKRLPVDFLKIDRSFIEGLEENHKDQVIVSAATGLAHALNLEVVAEGVETAEQLKQLRGLHCDQAQGYYFAKPLTKDEVPGFLASHNPRLWGKTSR